jgi:hypothetical protein
VFGGEKVKRSKIFEALNPQPLGKPHLPTVLSHAMIILTVHFVSLANIA